MPVSPLDIQRRIDAELVTVNDARVVSHVRGLLMEPVVVQRHWDYGVERIRPFLVGQFCATRKRTLQSFSVSSDLGRARLGVWLPNRSCTWVWTLDGYPRSWMHILNRLRPPRSPSGESFSRKVRSVLARRSPRKGTGHRPGLKSRGYVGYSRRGDITVGIVLRSIGDRSKITRIVHASGVPHV
jgi:hypothetical protein